MYIECPHCSAIFTLPTGLDQPKVRCGECGTIFDSKQAKSELVPEEGDTEFSDTTSLDSHLEEEVDDAVDLTSSELDAIENIDISISNELDAELDKFTTSEPSADELESEAALDDDFLFESRTLKKLSDTLELPVLDDMDYSDHSDSLRRNELAQTLDEADSEALTDDIFEEFISSNQIVGNITPSQGITSKNTGANINDDQNLLPELDENIEAVESTPTVDKLAETADDIRILESAPNTVFSDLGSEIEKDFNMTDEIEVPDLDQLQTLQNDVDQIVDQLPYAATNDDVINDVPFPPDEPSFTQQQMLLEPQDELPGIDEPVDTDDNQENNFLDGSIDDNQETPSDTLISLQNAEFDEPTLQTRFSKREYLYDNRALFSSLAVLLCLTLVLGAQYIRHNRDHFKHYAFTRPLANAVCNVSGCNVVPPREPENITILESSTYPHNSIENALTIKAKVVNQTGDDQPFPVLQVNFLNLAGAKIATRRFGPQEYLNKLPRRNGLMPPDEPVFFEINVADPSRDGVSFDLQIR